MEKALKALAGKNYEIVGTPPLPRTTDYPSWIAEEDVQALVVDERLGEQAKPGAPHIPYTGHEVVQCVRQAYPLLPIFVLTAFPDYPGLKSEFGAVEEIIDRRVFNRDMAPYVRRIARQAARYAEDRTKALKELAQLAERLSQGTATQKDKDRALALQTQLDASIAVGALATRAEWLSEAERQLDEIAQTRAELEELLSKGKRKPGPQRGRSRRGAR